MELLKKLYKINASSHHEEEMKSFVREMLAPTNAQIEEDSYGNLFVTRGTAQGYPCLVAHLDEIHDPVERTIIIENDDIVKALDPNGTPVGCGADDKNGIWIILKMLRETNMTLKASLFVQEEVGCKGSKNCNLDFFDDVYMLVGLDRKGHYDLVTEGRNIELSKAEDWDAEVLQQYKYTPVPGGLSDVVRLVERGLTIPACNLSVGYYNNHYDAEYTVMSELENAYIFTKALLRKMRGKLDPAKIAEADHWEQQFQKAKQMLEQANSMASNPEKEAEMWQLYVRARVYIQTEEVLYSNHSDEYPMLYETIDPVLDSLNPKYSVSPVNHVINKQK